MIATQYLSIIYDSNIDTSQYLHSSLKSDNHFINYLFTCFVEEAVQKSTYEIVFFCYLPRLYKNNNMSVNFYDGNKRFCHF